MGPSTTGSIRPCRASNDSVRSPVNHSWRPAWHRHTLDYYLRRFLSWRWANSRLLGGMTTLSSTGERGWWAIAGSLHVCDTSGRRQAVHRQPARRSSGSMTASAFAAASDTPTRRTTPRRSVQLINGESMRPKSTPVLTSTTTATLPATAAASLARRMAALRSALCETVAKTAAPARSRRRRLPQTENEVAGAYCTERTDGTKSTSTLRP